MKKMTSTSSILDKPTANTTPSAAVTSSESEPKTQVLVRLPESLHAAVKSKAAIKRMTITAVFEELLNKWVKEV
jgi:predicted DNA binding CopG/RHH family protein